MNGIAATDLQGRSREIASTENGLVLPKVHSLRGLARAFADRRHERRGDILILDVPGLKVHLRAEIVRRLGQEEALSREYVRMRAHLVHHGEAGRNPFTTTGRNVLNQNALARAVRNTGGRAVSFSIDELRNNPEVRPRLEQAALQLKNLHAREQDLICRACGLTPEGFLHRLREQEGSTYRTQELAYRRAAARRSPEEMAGQRELLLAREFRLAAEILPERKVEILARGVARLRDTNPGKIVPNAFERLLDADDRRRTDDFRVREIDPVVTGWRNAFAAAGIDPSRTLISAREASLARALLAPRSQGFFESEPDHALRYHLAGLMKQYVDDRLYQETKGFTYQVDKRVMLIREWLDAFVERPSAFQYEVG